MTAIVSTLTSLPFTQLRKNRYFYLWYDGFYALLCAALLGAMHFGGYEPFIQRWDNRFFFFVPSAIVGFLHLVHFNWSTHNAFSPEKDFKPVNLNHGFYKIGNYLWFGIYMHANHHKRANLFNPAKMDPSLPITPPPGKRLAE